MHKIHDIYSLRPNLDLSLLVVGAGFNGYFLLEEPNQPRLDTDEIFSLSRNEVPEWELEATYNWNVSAETASDYIQGLTLLAPLTLMASSKMRDEAFDIGVMAIQTMFLNQGLTGILKLHTDRKRPFVYNENAPIELKYRRQVFYSFPSAHTSASAAACFFTAKVFNDYYPDSKWKPLVWIGAATLPALTGYLRYEAGRHFISDIAAGYALGAVIGILIPELHKSNSKNFSIEAASMVDGFGVNLKWNISE